MYRVFVAERRVWDRREYSSAGNNDVDGYVYSFQILLQAAVQQQRWAPFINTHSWYDILSCVPQLRLETYNCYLPDLVQKFRTTIYIYIY